MVKELWTDRLFDNRPLTDEVYEGRMSHEYSIIDRNESLVVGKAHSISAAKEYIKSWRALWNVAGPFDIIETKTLTRDDKELFSSEISQETPHVRSHDPIADPMTVEYYGWDWELFTQDSIASHSPLPENILATKESLPVAPITKIRKPQKNNSKMVERSFSGISDPDILREFGYVVIDTRSQEKVFQGTKQLCKDYIDARNVSRSRDKLPIEFIKIVPWRMYSKYQEQVEKEGVAIVYRGEKVVMGLRPDVEMTIRKIAKSFSNVKHLKLRPLTITDLWWAQNRFDAMRKVG